MLYKALDTIRQLLNEHLKISFRLTEDMVCISPMKEGEGTAKSNRVVISLVNVERETAGGVQFKSQTVSANYSRKSAPSWQLNLYLLFAARFSEKHYTDSLRVFAGVLSFLQKNHVFTVQSSGWSLAIEPVNLSLQELANLWGVSGGSYYPSVLCKVRVLNVEGGEIIDLSRVSDSPQLKSGTQK